MPSDQTPAYLIKREDLPHLYPTNFHAGEFWEALGRTIGTFGVLEETLVKAIFAFTAQRKVDPENAKEEYLAWVHELEQTISDPLGGLLKRYSRAVKDYPDLRIENIDDLLADIEAAKNLRNVLCHGSWRPPNNTGETIPFFVNNRGLVFRTPIDIEYLRNVQAQTTELICDVVNSVTVHGWQFPSSGGPGSPIISEPKSD